MALWAPLSGLTYLALRDDDETVAAWFGIASAVATVGVAVGWEFYRQSQGPLAPKDEPQPATKGALPFVNAHLDPGEGYRVLRPAKAYGRETTILGILQGVSRFRACYGDDAPELRIGNISRLGGGPMPPHVSHRTGRDVDIMLPAGRDARWCLLRAYLEDPQVEMIFLDQSLIAAQRAYADELGGEDQALAGAELGKPGRVRHWPGHRDHVHVRFRDE